MEHTAVKWMANELLYLDNEFDMKLINKNEYQIKRKSIIEQAKEMEKEQIIDALMTSEVELLSWGISAEQYYKQTFKSE